MEKLKWHEYPQETQPKVSGKLTDCLIKGIGAVTHRQSYWLAFWLWDDDDSELRGFFYGGNRWNQTEKAEFEWLSCDEIDKATINE